MPVLKLNVSYLLLACAIVGLLANTALSHSTSPITSTGTGAEFCIKSSVGS